MGVALDGLNDLMALYDQPDAPSPTAAPSYRQALPLLRPALAEIAAEIAVPTPDGAITASGLLKYVAGQVSFDDALPTPFALGEGVTVLDAKVYVTVPFDAGTANIIQVSLGAANVPGGGGLSTFANASDVSQPQGAAVTGVVGISDVPQFVPAVVADNQAVYVSYAQDGTAATQGQATVVLTIATT